MRCEYKYLLVRIIFQVMARLKVDVPSLIMVFTFTWNIVISYFFPTNIILPRGLGEALLFSGFVFFAYVLFYLRKGFFGETVPKLDHLIVEGPYGFCRHPQYLSFFIMILGIDLMFMSLIGVVYTFIISIPSAIYRAKIEDKLLREKFGEEWNNYADKVGFILPKFRERQ